MISIPPCTANSRNIMLYDIRSILEVHIYVIVTGDDMHITIPKKRQEFTSLENQIRLLSSTQICSAIGRTMLTDINSRILWNQFKQSLHPRELLIIISLCIFMFASKSMNNVIKHDDHILADKECIILRTEILSISLSTLSICIKFMYMVMVTRNCIEWYACADNTLFPTRHQVVYIKTHIT